MVLMARTQTAPAPQLNFLFADHLVLEDSPTRDFYKDLLRGWAHKNNNTLAVVQGFTSLILMNDDLDENIIENVQQMRTSSLHNSTLSERVLAAGGCNRITPQRLNLLEFLPLMESKLIEICRVCGANMTLSLSAKAVPITADVSRFKEVLVELVRNAAEAANKGGKVELLLLAPGELSPIGEGRIDLVIRNSGPVIPEERLPQVFKPFMTTKGHNHFGLGLTIAAVLSGQMKMRLGLASGDGITTAWISAPAAI
ncbi:MAG: two-component system, NtrC family, nitrogen regulation sensor histidine kinase GlnL [Verrucomicrobia bacterium]|jgi:signal transduction histidine kinase|nr:MAG: two-component system, NtrC family, nitrogen regulation sensor histidine kinase GlnL [Verrucomicrobiota bacterium]